MPVKLEPKGPTPRLSPEEVEALAQEQAAGNHRRAKKWKSGPKPSTFVYVDSKGYPRFTVKVGGKKDRRVHEVIAEAMLGRELLPEEAVHHRDGDYLNFHWSNLVIINSDDHAAVSNKQRYYFKIMGWAIEPLKMREPGEDDDDHGVDEVKGPKGEEKAPF